MLQNPAPEPPRHRGRLRTTSADRTMQLLEAAADPDADAAGLRALCDDFDKHNGAALASLPGLGAN